MLSRFLAEMGFCAKLRKCPVLGGEFLLVVIFVSEIPQFYADYKNVNLLLCCDKKFIKIIKKPF